MYKKITFQDYNMETILHHDLAVSVKRTPGTAVRQKTRLPSGNRVSMHRGKFVIEKICLIL